MTKPGWKPRVYNIRPVPYDKCLYWPGTNILKSHHNVFNPAVKVCESPDWQKMQTRQDVSYHASKNVNTGWTTGGEFLSAMRRGLDK